MPNKPLPDTVAKLIVEVQISPNFGRYSIIIGLLLIILGSVGLFLPQIMSFETSFFIASLFIFGGIFWIIHSYQYSRNRWSEWLKPLLLLISGSLMLLYPVVSIAAVGLLLAIYLLLDAFGSFTLSYDIHPAKGWGWMAFNGVVSLMLAMLFLIGWPATSFYLVGLFVAISLFFDGWALLSLGLAARQLSK